METIFNYVEKIENKQRVVSCLLLIFGLSLLVISNIIQNDSLKCKSKNFRYHLKVIEYFGLIFTLLSVLSLSNLLNITINQNNVFIYLFLLMIVGFIVFSSGIMLYIESETLRIPNKGILICFIGLILTVFSIFSIYFLKKNNIH